NWISLAIAQSWPSAATQPLTTSDRVAVCRLHCWAPGAPVQLPTAFSPSINVKSSAVEPRVTPSMAGCLSADTKGVLMISSAKLVAVGKAWLAWALPATSWFVGVATATGVPMVGNAGTPTGCTVAARAGKLPAGAGGVGAPPRAGKAP